MATPKKTATGRWHAQIEIGGVRESNTLDTKREIDAWMARRSTELRMMKKGQVGSVKTLRDALHRYAEEVSPTKRGQRWELVRLKAFEGIEHKPLPLAKKIGEVTPADIALWRDARLAKVSRGTVLRDLTLIGAVFECARREWGWCAENVVRDVRKPANPDHRERVISGVEVRTMLRQLGWPKKRVSSMSEAVALCFFVALQTGMRAGELCGLEWPDVMADHLKIRQGKTGKRDVPMTPAVRKALDRLKGWDSVRVFGLKSQTLDALFRRARDRAGLEGFTFHDGRRTAATRMSKRVDVLMLCKILGWTNPKMAMTYYAPSMAHMAAKLDGR